MRTSLFAVLLLVSAAAFADDTKPPAIDDVRVFVRGGSVSIEAKITDETGVLSAVVHSRGKGGKVEDMPMTKNDFDDIFKASFPGGGTTEYWIESSDLLGNGPATYGTSSRPMVASSNAGRDSTAGGGAEPEPAREPRTRPHRSRTASADPPQQHHGRRGSKAAAEPKVIDHRKPATAPPEGQDLVTQPGDGGANTAGSLTFKGPPATATAPEDRTGWVFTHWPLNRVDSGRSIRVRAQIAPATDEGQVPGKAMVLWRGSDGSDQVADMLSDATGGWGGFKAELPSQADGAVYYQIVACDDLESKCAVDTASRKKWHGVAIGPQGSGLPPPLSASSSRAPAALADP